MHKVAPGGQGIGRRIVTWVVFRGGYLGGAAPPQTPRLGEERVVTLILVALHNLVRVLASGANPKARALNKSSGS